MSDSTFDQILTQRREARQSIVNVDEPQIQLVIFALGADWFAVHGERIREILAGGDVFFVPGSPPSMEGVINVRGDIESVIRLNDVLHLPESTQSAHSSILLGCTRQMTSGIRVDRVVDVVEVSLSQIQPPPSTLPEGLRTQVMGVLPFQNMPVAVLDLDNIFSTYARGLG